MFIGSRQTLKLHEIQCHREGKMKIVLDTPEQITKWREERKRNYPTVTNVTRKKAQQRQKIESGEILTTKDFRYNRKQGWKQQRRKNTRGKTVQREDNVASTQLENVTLSLPEKQSEGFTLKDGNLLDLNRNDTKCEETSGSLLNLGSLAADYATGSSDEEDNNIGQKDVPKKSAQSEHSPKPENKRQRLKENSDKQSQRKNSQARSRKKQLQPQNTTGSSRPRPTLLEMLLASDIRHERNVMLQCIRFIVRKNFFGIE
mgnify:FL=1